MSDDPEDQDQPVDGPDNAANPAQLKRRRTRIKLAEEQARTFWRQVFSTEIGRREMWGILESGHAFDERFLAGPTGFPQTEATWCQAGEQRLAFRLYRSWMCLDPDGVALMLRENDPALQNAP